jgi:hypothetical protein
MSISTIASSRIDMYERKHMMPDKINPPTASIKYSPPHTNTSIIPTISEEKKSLEAFKAPVLREFNEETDAIRVNNMASISEITPLTHMIPRPRNENETNTLDIEIYINNLKTQISKNFINSATLFQIYKFFKTDATIIKFTRRLSAILGQPFKKEIEGIRYYGWSI